MTILDFHTHLDTRWFDTPLMSEPAYVDGLKRCHVTAACAFTLMGFFEDSRTHNDLLLDRCQRLSRPDLPIYPFLTVDPKLGTASIAELERCLSTHQFRGVKFHPWLQSFAPSMVKSTMIDLLKRAAAAKLPVLFHDGTPPYSTTFQIAQCARWVPDCNVVLGHAGLADYNLPAADLLRDIPNLYGCLCGPKPADIALLAHTAGPHKLLFGSDFGLSDHQILSDRLDSLHHAGLSPTDEDQILHKTAATLLHL